MQTWGDRLCIRDDEEDYIVEPITLAAVGTVALTEGIKCLYAQAGEVLKCWRERREAAESSVASPDDTAHMDIKLPGAFEGQLSEPKIYFDAVERLHRDLRETRNDLADYAQDIEKVDNSNEDLLAKTDVLRRLLEAVLQERITFKGEQRPPSGPIVQGSIDVGEVAGYAAAVRKRKWTSVAHTVSYDAPNTKATVTPDATLAASRKYRVTVTTNVVSISGLALDQDAETSGNQPKSWSFTTRAN
jgi:Bacterial Ig-like domain